MEPLGIYVHWPFCHSKCPYCDFNSHVREAGDHVRWRDALLREIEHSSENAPQRAVTSIFFGGGTPSLMPPETVAAVIERIEILWGLDDEVEIIGVEAAGHGITTGQHAASLSGGRPGVLHGNRTYLLQTDDGQIIDAHSISAGLDYPGIGPEHSWLHDIKRVKYVAITDNEALDAFKLCCRLEGIIPALEPAHALAYVKKLAPQMGMEKIIVMNMCGRGDKDVFTVASALGTEL